LKESLGQRPLEEGPLGPRRLTGQSRLNPVRRQAPRPAAASADYSNTSGIKG
jgi:hypothetical protein